MQFATATKSRITASVAAVLLLVPLAACSAQGSSSIPLTHDGSALEAASQRVASGTQEISPDALPEAGRSVISTGSITIEVKDPRDAVEQATEVAERLGGYVQSQTVSDVGTGGPEGASLTIRVPSSTLNDAFRELGDLGKTLDESRSAEDVTAQHVDLQARVESLETSVARLTELMAGSATTSELIEAESALAARQAELDSLKAQLTVLEDQVDESTIWVSFTTNSALPGGPSNFWEGLLAGLHSLTVVGAGALVLLGILLPWLVIAAVIALVIVLLVRSGNRRRARRAAGQMPAAPAAAQVPGTTFDTPQSPVSGEASQSTPTPTPTAE